MNLPAHGTTSPDPSIASYIKATHVAKTVAESPGEIYVDLLAV